MGDIATKSVFLEAIERDDPAAYIEEVCTDPQQRLRARALLRAHVSADSLMANGEPASMLLDLAEPVRPDTRIRQELERIGPYKVERTLGEGGFGAVYLARQEDPIRRLVAIKVLKPGMDTRQIVRRFETERKALALMEHPSIARIIEAGQTDSGRPFVVMEHVDGPSITDYCDGKRLNLRERLGLFRQVCQAVQHAHHRGIIHRDIKPSNVLVTEVDGAPLVKVIDFGVAKAMESSNLDVTMTEGLQAIGTPAYMAPEQIVRGPGGVDTRTDVYGLGVLMYQLLTGRTPLDDQRLAGAGPGAIAQAICDVTPARPSTRIAGLGDEADNAAYARRLDTHRLWCHLKGDLDWITMRALEKDPARRYPTANALNEDVRRYLDREPVEASPPSRLYRLSLLVRRRPLEVGAVAVALIAIAALAVFGVQFGLRERAAADQARAQLKRADVLASFAQELLTGVDPAVARQEDTAMLRRILDSGVQRVGEELREYPEAAVSMLNAIGYAQVQIARFEEAERTFRAALVIAGDLDPLNSEVVSAVHSLAAVLAERGRLAESRALLVPHVASLREALDDDDEQTMTAMSNLASVHHRMGELDEALALLNPLLEARRRVLGESDPATLLTMNNLAMVHEDLGDDERARKMLGAVLEIQQRELGEDHPHTLGTLNNLAGLIRDGGDPEQARSMFEQVIKIKQRVLPENHPSTLISRHNLARTLLALGEAEQAEAISREVLAAAETGFGPDHKITLGARGGLARALAAMGRHAEAAEQFELAWRGLAAIAGEASEEALKLRIGLAESLAAHRPSEAKNHAEAILKLATGETAERARRVLELLQETDSDR